MSDNEVRATLERSLQPEPASVRTPDLVLRHAKRVHRRRKLTTGLAATLGCATIAVAAYLGGILAQGPTASQVASDTPTVPATRTAASGQAGRLGPPTGELARAVEQLCTEPIGPLYKKEHQTLAATGTPDDFTAVLSSADGSYYRCVAPKNYPKDTHASLIPGTPQAAGEPVRKDALSYAGIVVCAGEEPDPGCQPWIIGSGVVPTDIAKLTFDRPDGTAISATVADGRWAVSFGIPGDDRSPSVPKQLRVRAYDSNGTARFDDLVELKREEP